MLKQANQKKTVSYRFEYVDKNDLPDDCIKCVRPKMSDEENKKRKQENLKNGRTKNMFFQFVIKKLKI